MAASRAWVAAGKAGQSVPVLSGKCSSQHSDARCSAFRSWPAVGPRDLYSKLTKGGNITQCRYNVADLFRYKRHSKASQHRLARRAERERVVGVSATLEQGVTIVVGAEATKEAPASDNAGTNVQAVLFDMDGVLCDSEDRSRQAAVELFKELGFEVTEEDFIPFMGTGEANFLGGVARKFGVPDWDVTKAKARFFEIYIGKYALPDSGLGYSGALELIQAVKRAGLKAAVASSADLVKVNANLAAAGLPLTNFDAVVSADLFERLKPSPDIFLAASKALGVPPSQCVVIEDALAGVQAALAAGMRCIGVTTSLDAAALAPGGPALVRKDISHITLDDILTVKYPPSNNDDQNETPAQLLKELKQSGGKEGIAKGLQSVLNATVDLPGGFSTRRRDVLRLGAGLIGLTSTYIAFTRAKNQPDVRAWIRTKGWWLAWVWQAAIIAYCVRAFPYWRKAMSYVSPRAVLNQLFGAPAPGVAEAAEDRVKQFKKYIRDMEKRGGGTTVPEFQQGLAWLNTAPLKLSKELRGRVLVLDFWTYCCINCMHILPDLAFLEKKYKDQPVTVVGVHSAKFDNEKDTEAIREAVLRYDVVHPVVNDGEMTMWRGLGVSSWPTLAVVSPKGKLLAMLAGEGHRQDIDELLQAALEYYGEQGDLKNDPLPISLEKDKDSRVAKSPLRFPGKIATDLKNKRLFISDSSQHRIVVTDLKGNFITQIGGGGGEGLRDGAFEFAAFNRPQGLAYHSGRDLLYVADTENHAFREVNLGSGMVRTLAGNGKQGADYRGGGSGPTQLLNSPWDVVVDEARNVAYVAMAGQHQLWKYDIAGNTIGQFSGDGYERNLNGPSGTKSSFAQPSGLSLTPDGSSMYVADSESSSVRVVNTATGGSQSNVGGDPYFSDNLFQFGDVDGQGGSARLQHPLGVLYDPAGGKVFVADSYNHKVKIMDPSKNLVQTLAGTGKPGFRDGTGGEVQFSEPNGLALGEDGDVYVADTNNSLIRVIHTRDGNKVSTLSLSGVPPPPEAPAAARRKRRAVDTELVKVDEVSASSGNLVLQISLPPGYHYTQGATSKYEVESDPSNGVTVQPAAGDLSSARDGPSATLKFTRSSTAASSVRINCKVYYCEDSDTVCLFKGVTFEVPFSPSESSSSTVTLPYLVTPDKTPSNVTNSFLIKP